MRGTLGLKYGDRRSSKDEDYFTELSPGSFASKAVVNKLEALNYFRVGDLVEALGDGWGLDPEDYNLPFEVDVASYSVGGSAKFKRDMRKIVKMLKKVGL